MERFFHFSKKSSVLAQALLNARSMNQKIPRRPSLRCPYNDCENRSLSLGITRAHPNSGLIVRRGRYLRAEDSRWISRYRCLGCKRSFSSSRLTPCFRQKKRRLNSSIHKLLSSGVSQRRIARLLKINSKTVVRKFLFLATQAKSERIAFLGELSTSPSRICHLHFDEMESFERSKCLPLSIPLVVEAGSRKILGFRVGRMPAKGPLASISLRKYGPREDDRASIVGDLFRELKSAVAENAQIRSDQNPRYPDWLKPHFPKANHRTFKGRRGCIVGQGELKKIGFDPLFDLNHTAAMLRANVNRLFRRTWCTTKKRDRLEAHLEIYAQYHNQVLTA